MGVTMVITIQEVEDQPATLANVALPCVPLASGCVDATSVSVI